jgi:hypothetical protein
MADFFSSLSPRAKALWQAITQRGGSVEERADVARNASEEASKVLPASVMPREAVLRKRKQLQDIDQMLKDADR